MKLVELPNGEWIAPSIVCGVRSIVDDKHGFRAVISLTTPGEQYILLRFNSAELTLDWEQKFVQLVNAAENHDSEPQTRTIVHI